MDAALELAAAFAAKSPTTLRAGRADFVRINDRGYREDIVAAVETFCDVAVSASAQEGIRAFLEKRRPQWPEEH